MLDTSIFTAPVAQVDRKMVKQFLAEQAVERLFLESSTLEFKVSLRRLNVVEAICALANTDGGLVLVGVDEERPDHAPGVEPSAFDSLMNQCRMTLQPSFCPEVIPVPADTSGRVILVVRVEAEQASQPVFCNGTVFVRVPGSTVRASRDQILGMVRAQSSLGSASFGGAVQSLSGLYCPPAETGGPTDTGLPDLRFRAVGAVDLRSEVRRRIVLGNPLRRLLSSAVDDSELLRWATGHEARAVTGWTTHVSREHNWRQVRPLPRRWEPTNVPACFEARTEGSRLSWCLDIDILDEDFRRKRKEQQPAAIMSAHHMVRGLVEAAHLVGTTIPAVVAAQLASPPSAPPQAVLWVMPARRDLRWAVNLDQLRHEVDDRALGEAQLELESEGVTDPQTAVLDWLQRALLNDGVTDAEAVADAIVEQAMSGRIDDPWLL